VAINRPQMVIGTPALPMGGFKQSGIGRRNGVEGLLRFVQTQAVLTDTLFATPPSLIFTDKVTLTAFRAMRAIRRVVPFI
jgi:succinate-semialdehyde dehydrogenase/glutarate-semialdehyde dehydrogenase